MKTSYIAYITMAAIGAFSASIAAAQDKQTLDLLVAKGVISKAEADSVSKKFVEVSPKEKTTKSIKLIGRVQTQYEYILVDEYDGSSTTDLSSKGDFIMRRMFLGMTAGIGSGWSATVIADFARSSDNYLEYAYITKKLDWQFLNGTSDMGYKKTTFALEEYTSASKLLTVERSLATRYFSESNNGRRLGFAGRHTGLYWNGFVDGIEGFSYGFSVTNSYNNSPASIPSGTDNSLLYCANVSFKTSVDDLKIETGINLAYTNGMNVAGSSGNHSASVKGANPYLKFSRGGFSMWSDFLLADVEDGKVAYSENIMPMGVNVAAEYIFDMGDAGGIAPVIRWSWIDTDGRGIKMSDGIRNSPASSVYNAGQSIYIGANWYICGNDLKLQAGYEWAQLSGSISDDNLVRRSDGNAVRAQLQVLF